MRNALTFDAHHFAELNAGRDLELDRAFQGGNLQLLTQRSLSDGDGNIQLQVIAIAAEVVVGTNAYVDIEVARHPAALTVVGGISLAAEADAGPIVYAG